MSNQEMEIVQNEELHTDSLKVETQTHDETTHKHDKGHEKIDDLSNSMDESDDDNGEKDEKEEKIKDVTGDGGVMKEIIKKGTGYSTPHKGNDVTVHYVGTLTDGTKFDSSRDRNDPFKFKLGEGQVIKGWDKVVETMKKGEVCRVTLKPEYAYGKAGSPPKIPADATLIFEIELISWGEEKDLSNDGGVMKKIIKEGDKWDTPNYEAKCRFKLITKNHKGVIVESINEKELVIGNEAITEGLEKALTSMKRNEHAIVRVTSKYAYGSSGNDKLNIPPDTDLEYEIHLFDFEKGKESWELNKFEDKYEVAIRRKNEGNFFFNNNQYDLALKKYDNALSLFKYSSDDKKEHKKEIDTLKIDCYSNRAAVELKIGKLKDAIQHTTKAIEIDDRNVKALWRRGTAYTQNGDWMFAKKDYEKALEIDPTNKTVKNSLTQLKKKIAEEDRRDREKYQNVFQKLAEQREKDEKVKEQKKKQEEKSKRKLEKDNISNTEATPLTDNEVKPTN